MVEKAFLAMLQRVLCAILCQFCDCCEDNENCPEGACIDLRQAIDDFDHGTPDVNAVDSKVGFREINIQWDELQATIQSLTAAVRQLMKLFGVAS